LIDQVQQNAAELQHHNATARQHHNKPTPSAELFTVATTGWEQHRSDNRRIAIEHKTQPTPLINTITTNHNVATNSSWRASCGIKTDRAKQASRQASKRAN